MPTNQALKTRVLDEKDKQILMILQKDGRKSLTEIAKSVNLSIDSVNKRMKAMQSKGVFEVRANINPKVCGFPLVADIKIKLYNITEEDKNNFISYLVNEPRSSSLFSVLGEYDFTLVLNTKDAAELDILSTRIRQKYSHIIADWKSFLVMRVHKIEYYDLTGKDPATIMYL